MTGSERDGGRALLIGNSRWHWAQRQDHGVCVDHGSPDPGRIGADPPVWAAVGPVPEQLMVHQDLRIRLEDVPLPQAPPWLGVDRALGAWMAWRCSQERKLDCSRGLLLVDAGTVLSLTRVTADGSFGGGQLIPGYRLQLQAMAEGTLGLPSTPELPDNDALQEVFPQLTVAAMQRGVLEAMLASIATAQQHSKGLVWICGGDAALLKRHWTGPTELLQLEDDLQLQALLNLAAGLSSGRDR
ncbi:type III pantothenate kinase [Parasynechococcus sp.]|uniref:type III pantothenate kinase n=1 Tax=Parasynechococcus sp. TaxID=3101203 RepID=UPI0037040BF5